MRCSICRLDCITNSLPSDMYTYERVIGSPKRERVCDECVIAFGLGNGTERSTIATQRRTVILAMKIQDRAIAIERSKELAVEEIYQNAAGWDVLIFEDRSVMKLSGSHVMGVM